MLLAGVSDQGMSDPAHLTAISLTQCSALLGLMFPTVVPTENLVPPLCTLGIIEDLASAC